MKRILILSIGLIVFSTACVTKQKYMELDGKYLAATKNLNAVTAEKIRLENAKTELEVNVERLKSNVEALKKDSFNLSKKLAEVERDYAKAKKDYDDLLLDLETVNTGKNKEINTLLYDLEQAKANLMAKELELNDKATQLQELEDALKLKEARLTDLQNILDQKDRETQALKNKISQALRGFESSGLSVYEKDGKIYVSMDNKLLFASASWEVGAQGENALKELAKILETEPNISIMVEGHTDDVPFKGIGNVKDNWDLSTVRATSIVRIILKHGNIDPQRITAAGRGEFFPIDHSKTPEARAKNRRTEIILTPRLDELYKLLESK